MILCRGNDDSTLVVTGKGNDRDNGNDGSSGNSEHEVQSSQNSDCAIIKNKEDVSCYNDKRGCDK